MFLNKSYTKHIQSLVQGSDIFVWKLFCHSMKGKAVSYRYIKLFIISIWYDLSKKYQVYRG